jgi:hypothetical protein
MSIVCSGYKTYYQVMHRTPGSTVGNFSLCYCLGCYEDIRDAVNRIVSLYRDKPDCRGQLGIVRTSIFDKAKFVASTYRD